MPVSGRASPGLIGKMAKPYQCRQVADAIEAKLRGNG
jgi:hypothetical protein